MHQMTFAWVGDMVEIAVYDRWYVDRVLVARDRD